MAEISENSAQDLKWHHPSDVMKLHKLKKKKKALQARIKNVNLLPNISKFDEIFSTQKRKNPFLPTGDSKRTKIESCPVLKEKANQSLALIQNSSLERNHTTHLESVSNDQSVELVQAQEKTWIPIDWSLKNKMRLLSLKPFSWNLKLKVSEEASGVTAFTRCLDNNTDTTLDMSSNAKFYQCCLYWQQPALPWLTLFPRNSCKIQQSEFTVNLIMKENLQKSWSDSLRSLFQLFRTGQCPYFYVCANNFTVLFRAAGICGFSDAHAIITPTTRGFRKLLEQEDIEYTLPLKIKIKSEQDYGTMDCSVDEEKEVPAEENWLKSLGVNDDDIKQISYAQDLIQHETECQVDNSEQSTVLIEGIEVNALYNFLINCKSATSVTGPLADIPPTLLAPVAFHGASLNALKIRENKVHSEDANYYSLELSGPILPSTVHNLFEISPPENNMTITFNTTKTTEPFSKLKTKERKSDLVNMGAIVFRKENLSDCGLLPNVLKHFCLPENNHVANVECLKYVRENKSFTWS